MHTNIQTHMRFMKNILLFVMSLASVLPLAAKPHGDAVGRELFRLDSLIAQKSSLEAMKEQRIDRLRQQRKRHMSAEQEFMLNELFHKEFSIYDADSAFRYINRNIVLADSMGWGERKISYKIKKSHVLAATGLLKEASDEVRGLGGQAMSKELSVEYYGQMVYLYSHFGQYMGEGASNRAKYHALETLYKDSVCAVISPEHPDYLWHQGNRLCGTGQTGELMKELKKEVDASGLDENRDAMNAYILARMYREKGDMENYQKYIIRSAQADVYICNRDIASLEEFSKVLFDMGDIDRAYTYANYCLQTGRAFHNRIRVSGILNVLDEIHKAYQERNRIQQARLCKSLVSVSILSVVLLAAFFYIRRQVKRLDRSKRELNAANGQLGEQVARLSEAHRLLKEANDALQKLNEELHDANDQLRESNYVKEEYIGHVFALCSAYIGKLDDFRKLANRKLKANQADELRRLTETSVVKEEMKEFYHNFDVLFLHVYPNFVNDFNGLLRPEERVTLKEGELLNTDLRIYALVRLGINDSVKIAEFLHCSPQTVYNNRLKMRGRAIIPKEEFANRVKQLGKMQG